MRNTRGHSVAPDKDEKVKGQTAIESEENSGKHDDPAEHLKNCEDCMKNVMVHIGKGMPADGMKGQDQGGKTSGSGEGHDTVRQANYARKRN